MFDENSIFHSLLVCDFPCKMVPLEVGEFGDYLHAITGIQFSERDLWTMAERVETRIRLYNLREGLSRGDDTLPWRVFRRGPAGRTSKGSSN